MWRGSRFRRAVGSVAAVIVAGGISMGGWYVNPVGGGGGGGGPTANLWIDTTGGTCVRNSSPAVYNDAAACSSMQVAMAACTAGDTIRMKNGTYAAQTVTQSLGSPGCTIIGESQSGVVTGNISLNGDYGTVQDVTADVGTSHDVGLGMGGTHNTFKNVLAHGQYVAVNIGGDSNTWNGGELGCNGCTAGQRDFCGSDAEPVVIFDATNVLVQDINLWPQATVANASCNHMEMFRIDSDGSPGTNNVTLNRVDIKPGDGSTTAAIFITATTGSSSTPSNVTIKNSVISQEDASSYGINVHSNVASCATIVLAYDFLPQDRAIQCATTTGMTWTGNLGSKPSGTCPGTFTKNVWQSNINHSCGTDTWVSGPDFSVSNLGVSTDGRLSSGSAAINAAESAGYCTSTLGSVDIEGGTRPNSTACDAGADEFGVP